MRITKEWISQICFEEVLPLWRELPETFPDFLTEWDEKEKSENEAYLKEHMEKMQKAFSLFPEDTSQRQEWKCELQKQMDAFVEGEKILDISGLMGKELYLEFERETKRFLKKTRSFDAQLGLESIWQAIRNYFIYAMIADLENQKQNCKDPVFAYSLLYPYTDNYIDSRSRKRDEKEQYNRLIRSVLSGKAANPQNTLEEMTARLLHIALDFYEGEKRTEVQNLLLLMLEAQEKSIKQQKARGFGKQSRKELSEEEILRISAYKGGISVLNDYVFSVDVTETEAAAFYLKFGFILQLSDDLQDIAEDSKERSSTIMTYAAKAKKLEGTVNRLLHFTYRVMQEYEPENKRLHTFAVRNCLLMILSTVAISRKYFSGSYLKKIEVYLPFHHTFLSDMQKYLFGSMPDQVSMMTRQMEILDIMADE